MCVFVCLSPLCSKEGYHIISAIMLPFPSISQTTHKNFRSICIIWTRRFCAWQMGREREGDTQAPPSIPDTFYRILKITHSSRLIWIHDELISRIWLLLASHLIVNIRRMKTLLREFCYLHQIKHYQYSSANCFLLVFHPRKLHRSSFLSYRNVCRGVSGREGCIQTLSNFCYWMLIALSIMYDCFIKTKKYMREPEPEQSFSSKNEATRETRGE